MWCVCVLVLCAGVGHACVLDETSIQLMKLQSVEERESDPEANEVCVTL